MATSVTTKVPPIVTMVTRPSITYAEVCAPSHERQAANQIEARGNAGNRRVIKGYKKSVAKDGGDNGSPPFPKSSGGVTSLPIQLMAFQTDPMPPTHSTDHDPTKNSPRVSLDQAFPLPITNTPDPCVCVCVGGGGVPSTSKPPWKHNRSRLSCQCSSFFKTIKE